MISNLVIWDVDRVWYPDISTTYASKGSNQKQGDLLPEGYEQKWVTPEQVQLWESVTGRKLGSPGNEYVGALADM